MSKKLLSEIRNCTFCKVQLPHSPKPILNFSSKSKIIIIGQAPGIKAHESGIPWHDASGDRLRTWLGVSIDEFYDPENFAIVPMGFCYPGKGNNGDLPPRPECASLWMDKIIASLKHKQLTLLIGQYSQNFFLNDITKRTLTERVKHYQEYLPDYVVLPHPSPRNNIWLKKHPWFMKHNLPMLQKTIRSILQ